MTKIRMSLEGLDGNAFSLLGAFAEKATQQGWSAEAIDAVRQEAMAGDYGHLLQTLAEHTEDASAVEMRIWWSTQPPGDRFHYPVPDVASASLLLDALATFGAFRVEQHSMPDRGNLGGAEWRHPVLTGGEWVEFDPDDASDRIELAAVIADPARENGRSN